MAINFIPRGNLSDDVLATYAENDKDLFLESVSISYMFIPKPWLNSDGQLDFSTFTAMFVYVLHLIDKHPLITWSELMDNPKIVMPRGFIMEMVFVIFFWFRV